LSEWLNLRVCVAVDRVCVQPEPHTDQAAVLRDYRIGEIVSKTLPGSKRTPSCQRWWRAGFEMPLLGGVVAVAAYGAGALVVAVVGDI